MNFRSRVGLCSRAGRAGLALLLFLITFNAFAQDDYYIKLEQGSLDEANNGQYASSLEKARELYAAYQDNINAHIIAAYDMIMLGRYKDAGGYIDASFAIDPTNFSAYYNAAYYYALDGNIEMSKKIFFGDVKVLCPDISCEGGAG